MGRSIMATLRRESIISPKLALPSLFLTLAACSGSAKEQATCAGLVGWEDDAKPLPSSSIEVAHVTNQKATGQVGDDISCSADVTSYSGSTRSIAYTMEWDKIFKMYAAKATPEDASFLGESARLRYEKGQLEMVERMLKDRH
jgi:hypothetical protein